MLTLNKKRLSIALAATAMILSTSAYADTDLKPYYGFDIQRTNIKYNDNVDGTGVDAGTILEDTLNGINIHAGIRPHKNVGFELGYFLTSEESKSIATGASIGGGLTSSADFNTKIRLSGFTIDSLGYLPIDKDEKFDLVGTAGLVYTKAELAANIPGVGSVSSDESEIGLRLGGGAQYNFNDSFNVRGLARYQTADFEDTADNAWTYTVGLNYGF
jgi:opacity protein-like surface antigen